MRFIIAERIPTSIKCINISISIYIFTEKITQKYNIIQSSSFQRFPNQSITGTAMGFLCKICIFRKFTPNTCTTIHIYSIFSTRYSVICKVYTGYCGTSEIEHGLCACTVDNPLAKARGFSLRTGAQTMLYLSLVCHLYMS